MMKIVMFFLLMLSTIVYGQERNLKIKDNKAGLYPLVSIINFDINSTPLSSYKMDVILTRTKKQNKQHTFHPTKKALTLTEYKQLTNSKLSAISKKRISKKNDE